MVVVFALLVLSGLVGYAQSVREKNNEAIPPPQQQVDSYDYGYSSP